MQAAAEHKKLHLLTVEEYMTLQTSARTELLGGVIFAVSPKKEPHSHAVAVLAKALNRGLPDSFSVRIQDPIAVSGWTGRDAPEVDIAVVAARRYTFTPAACDAFAFIEVADSTYGGRRGDRRYKIPLYVPRGFPRGSSTCGPAASNAMCQRAISHDRTGARSAKARRSTCWASQFRLAISFSATTLQVVSWFRDLTPDIICIYLGSECYYRTLGQ